MILYRFFFSFHRKDRCKCTCVFILFDSRRTSFYSTTRKFEVAHFDAFGANAKQLLWWRWWYVFYLKYHHHHCREQNEEKRSKCPFLRLYVCVCVFSKCKWKAQKANQADDWILLEQEREPTEFYTKFLFSASTYRLYATTRRRTSENKNSRRHHSQFSYICMRKFWIALLVKVQLSKYSNRFLSFSPIWDFFALFYLMSLIRFWARFQLSFFPSFYQSNQMQIWWIFFWWIFPFDGKIDRYEEFRFYRKLLSTFGTVVRSSFPFFLLSTVTAIKIYGVSSAHPRNELNISFRLFRWWFGVKSACIACTTCMF